MIDINEFHVVRPVSKETLSFNIMADGVLRLNSKLNRKMIGDSKKRGLRIRVNKNGSRILLEEVERDAADDIHVITKGDTAKASGLLDELDEMGIKIPAHYNVVYIQSSGMWLGKNNSNHTFQIPAISPQKLKKPRKKDLREMLPE